MRREIAIAYNRPAEVMELWRFSLFNAFNEATFSRVQTSIRRRHILIQVAVSDVTFMQTVCVYDRLPIFTSQPCSRWLKTLHILHAYNWPICRNISNTTCSWRDEIKKLLIAWFLDNMTSNNLGQCLVKLLLIGLHWALHVVTIRQSLVRYMLSPVCLSSVTFVRPTQAVQIFGNISTALGTLTSTENFTGDRPKGTPPRRGVKHKRGSQI